MKASLHAQLRYVELEAQRLFRAAGRLERIAQDMRASLAKTRSTTPQYEAVITRVLVAVALEYRIPVEDLITSRRNQVYSRARQVVVYVCRRRYQVSWMALARAVRRDHSTLHKTNQQFLQRLKEDPTLTTLVRRVNEALNTEPDE